MRFAVMCFLAMSVGCGESERPRPGAADEIDPIALLDMAPDPNTVEVALVASVGQWEYLEGKPTEVWGYRDGSREDGQVVIPGPLLAAKVGDQVIVHFTNELPEETTIHWHGIRLDAAMDGSPASQVPIAPGGSFTYEFIAQDAGYFWYHPHVRGDVQIERGLYAPLVVRADDGVAVDRERLFVLDDVKVTADGALSEETTAVDLMMGRDGNLLLANGRVSPVVHTQDGARERWRFVNSANGRFFNLRLPGHAFTVIGWDGGLLPASYQAETLLIAPGERYDVVVTLAGDGDLPVETAHYDRGHDLPDPGPKTVFTVHLDGQRKGGELPELPTTWSEAPSLAVESETVERELVLTETMEGATPTFFINGMAWPNHYEMSGALEDIEIWRIQNDAEMDHPFHLHGMFFQVLDIDGVAPAQSGWKDTVIVPKHATLRFAVRYEAAGDWMYHCHILEHAELGMMGMLSVH